ncbi:MAG: LysM peptidoglycan-binding domain-containing protein [Thermoanaerobaculia bacterium]
MRGRNRFRCGLILTVLMTASAAAAQQPKPGDTLGWHLVREGETLESITELYLGTSILWRDNHRLNPQIRDPHRIYPGQRIHVILNRELAARRVRIEEIANQVDKNLQRSGWQGAAPGDELQPLDGVRTGVRSSTELEFGEGSKLTLTELSRIFVKDVSISVTGVRREAIEIERGQADLDLVASRPDRIEIEIEIGGTVARPRVGPTGRAQTRARKPEGGGSQVMVYGGTSEVEAGGRSVHVARGMGTTVPQGGAPAPPEKLLPRPATVRPARGSRWAFANPPFEWRPVAGAVSYTVEVCRDAGCGRLVARGVGLVDSRWPSPPLPSGDFYWRVTAVSVSGLDGFPSRAVPFAVTGGADVGPPVVVAALAGAGHVTEDGVLVLGEGAGVRLDAHDDAAGVAEVRYRWDSGSWQTWSGGDLEPPSAASEAILEFQATDLGGRVSQVWSVRVARDADGPEAPRAVRGTGR